MKAKDWHKEETYKSLILIGLSALKFVLLANGGAAVAILAFIGKVYSPEMAPLNVAPSLGWFLAGIAFGGFAHITAYMTQFSLYNELERKKRLIFGVRHQVWLLASVILVVLGIICFGVGSWCGIASIAV